MAKKNAKKKAATPRKATKKRASQKKAGKTRPAGRTARFSRKQAQEAVHRAKRAAADYAKDPEKTRHLLDEAVKRADQHRGPLKKVWDDLMTLFRLLRAWIKGEYKDVPWQTMVLVIAAIIYFVNPFDVIPDFFPFVGYIDDTAVIALVVKSIKADIETFRDWEKTDHCR